MLGRISSAAALLLLLAPALGAQATERSPRLRSPRPVADGALLALLPPARFVVGPDVREPVSFRFDPFTRESREDAAQVRPSLPERSRVPRCPMPVQRSDSTHDPMPVATPDSTKKYVILVAPPECVAEDAR
ncbi:MAG TPA: hypothetical protein VFT57_10475 [Gemmatimonadaceae bacterium]|jgi:hypothetical protein|nr:hypothetical protein [Gemmatimonadaceae bacterium]